MYLYTHVHCLLLKASITGNKPKNILIWLFCKLQNTPHLEGPYQWVLFSVGFIHVAEAVPSLWLHFRAGSCKVVVVHDLQI